MLLLILITASDQESSHHHFTYDNHALILAHASIVRYFPASLSHADNYLPCTQSNKLSVLFTEFTGSSQVYSILKSIMSTLETFHLTAASLSEHIAHNDMGPAPEKAMIIMKHYMKGAVRGALCYALTWYFTRAILPAQICK